MLKITPEVILYDNPKDLEFPTEHPYWLSLDGYYIKLSKTHYEEISDMFAPKPELSDSEKMILSAVDPKYQWIARDKDNELYVYTKEPKYEPVLEQFLSIGDSKGYEPLNVFNNLFTEIKPTKKYKIQDVINA